MKVIDFGFALDISTDDYDKTVLCGSPGYFAPELLLQPDYSIKTDIFSIGCVLY